MYAGVRSTVFRIWDKPTIVADFVIRWALAHGLARIRVHTHTLACADGRRRCRLPARSAEFVGRLDRFFCINDTTDDAGPSDPRLARARVSLEALFPRPSQYERRASTEPVSITV